MRKVSLILVLIVLALSACSIPAKGNGLGGLWIFGGGIEEDLEDELEVDLGEQDYQDSQDGEGLQDLQVQEIEVVSWLDLVELYGLEVRKEIPEGFIELSFDYDVQATRTYKLFRDLVLTDQVNILVSSPVGEVIEIKEMSVYSGDSLFYKVRQESPDVNFELFIKSEEIGDFIILETDLGEGQKMYKVPYEFENVFQEMQGVVLDNLFWSGEDSPMRFISSESGFFDQGEGEVEVFIEQFESGNSIIEYIFADDLIAIREVLEDLQVDPVVRVHLVDIEYEIGVEKDLSKSEEVPEGLQEWIGDMLYVYTTGQFGEPTDFNEWSPNTELEEENE